MFSYFKKVQESPIEQEENKMSFPSPDNSIKIDINRKAVKPNLDPKIIENIKYQFRSQNSVELVNANIRNVLFCGASRSGKTTTFKVLQDCCYCPEKSTIFSETEDTIFKTFSLKDKKTNEVHGFILNLIDSPGTFEIRSSKDEFVKRSNNEIGKLIVDCLNHEVTYLNLIIMFVALAAKVNEADIDSIELFMEMFGVEKSKIPILLCLTRADEHNKFRRETTEEEIQQHPRLKKFFEKDMLKIIFMGCVDHIHKDYKEQDSLIEDYWNVNEWRGLLLENLFKADERIDLKDTNIYGNRIQTVVEAMKISIKELKYLRNLDEETGEYKQRIFTLNENMQYVYKNKIYLDPENNDQMDIANELGDIIDQVKKDTKLHVMKRKNLISPWSVPINE